MRVFVTRSIPEAGLGLLRQRGRLGVRALDMWHLLHVLDGLCQTMEDTR